MKREKVERDGRTGRASPLGRGEAEEEDLEWTGGGVDGRRRSGQEEFKTEFSISPSFQINNYITLFYFSFYSDRNKMSLIFPVISLQSKPLFGK